MKSNACVTIAIASFVSAVSAGCGGGSRAGAFEGTYTGQVMISLVDTAGTGGASTTAINNTELATITGSSEGNSDMVVEFPQFVMLESGPIPCLLNATRQTDIQAIITPGQTCSMMFTSSYTDSNGTNLSSQMLTFVINSGTVSVAGDSLNVAISGTAANAQGSGITSSGTFTTTYVATRR